MSGTISGEERRARVTRRAIELQERERTDQERSRDEAHFRAAAAEVGIEGRLLDEAERQIVEEERERERVSAQRAEQRAKTLRRALAASVGAAVAVGVAAAGGRILFPPAPEPWVMPLDGPSGASLDVDPSSRATLRFVEVSGRGQVAEIAVERFVPDAQGQYRANLDVLPVPASLRGYQTVSVDLSGDLPAARLYLEAGPNERWRSPALSVTSEWKTHDIPLSAFEHQVQIGRAHV